MPQQHKIQFGYNIYRKYLIRAEEPFFHIERDSDREGEERKKRSRYVFVGLHIT